MNSTGQLYLCTNIQHIQTDRHIHMCILMHMCKHTCMHTHTHTHTHTLSLSLSLCDFSPVHKVALKRCSVYCLAPHRSVLYLRTEEKMLQVSCTYLFDWLDFGEDDAYYPKCTHKHKHTLTYTRTHTHANMHTCTSTHLCAHTRDTRTYTHTYTCTYLHTPTHTDIHTLTHTYIHAHTPPHPPSPPPPTHTHTHKSTPDHLCKSTTHNKILFTCNAQPHLCN